jgi:predicted ATPase with chaperone activity
MPRLTLDGDEVGLRTVNKADRHQSSRSSMLDRPPVPGPEMMPFPRRGADAPIGPPGMLEPQPLPSGVPLPSGHEAVARRESEDPRLEELINRVRSQIPGVAAKPTTSTTPGAPAPPAQFIPVEPNTFKEAQLSESFIESLLLKYLLAQGDASGRDAAEQVKLSFKLVDGLLRQMKQDQMVVHRGSAPMGDYQYQLTDMGRERARRFSEHCTYFGAAPVSIKDYIASVGAQSLTHQHPTVADLEHAFSDLLMNKDMLRRLGPAINSGRGLFLFGAPGNGKSSIAERISRAFGQYIWIPRALSVDGEIIRLYDPSNHESAPVQKNTGLLDNQNIDGRWIRIVRPTIIVGGELTMASLEVTLNTSTGISEAPIQLKSNCGTLVIDDFGRQRMSTDELLNRWIVPLEKRYDYLNLPNGKKIQVPFDQLIVFSTNLEPRDLVDDAFLRRIPYKIDVCDPTEEEFRDLFRQLAPKMGIEYRENVIDYLIHRHYRSVKRPFRCCQPRDLLLQIRSYCNYVKVAPQMTTEYFDFAVDNYFAAM